MKKLLLFLFISANCFAVNSENCFFSTTVTTATTAVPLSTSIGNLSSMLCEPCSGNSGTYMYWGDENVSPTNSIRLEKASDSISYETSEGAKMSNEVEPSTIWIESDTNGDKMCCQCVKSK